MTNGHLQVKFSSSNFRPTHGAEFVYDVTIEGVNDNELKYTVRSDLGTESTKARRTK